MVLKNVFVKCYLKSLSKFLKTEKSQLFKRFKSKTMISILLIY